MKKIIIVLLTIIFLTACGSSSKKENVPLELLPPEETEASETVENDWQEETIQKEAPVEEPVTQKEALEESDPEEISEETPEVTAAEEITEPVPADEPVQTVTAVVSNSGGSTIDLPSGTTVWKSETGSKFHSVNDCGNMNPNKAIQITVDEAVNKYQLEACEKCF